MKTTIKYAALILIGFLIACYFTCESKSTKDDNRKKIDSLRAEIETKRQSIKQISNYKKSRLDSLRKDIKNAESEAQQVTTRYHEKINRPAVLPDSTLEAMYRHVTRE